MKSEIKTELNKIASSLGETKAREVLHYMLGYNSASKEYNFWDSLGKALIELGYCD